MKNLTYIWYNPEISAYQMGPLSLYKEIRNESKAQNDFNLLYKFDGTQNTLAKKILTSLNITSEANTGSNMEESPFR